MGIIGILGGMGPQATIDFYQRLLHNTPATRDEEHLQVLMWSDPLIPERTLAIVGQGTSPTPSLVMGAEKLRLGGACCIAVPCNTAHFFLPAVQKAVPSVPIFDMIKISVHALRATLPIGAIVGITATDGTLKSELYQLALRQARLQPLLPLPAEQALLMSVIFGDAGVKAGFVSDTNEERLLSVAKSLQKRGASAVIVGCTELSLVATKTKAAMPVCDPMDELVKAVVAFGRGISDFPHYWVD